jgi:hypothetical protein
MELCHFLQMLSEINVGTIAHSIFEHGLCWSIPHEVRPLSWIMVSSGLSGYWYRFSGIGLEKFGVGSCVLAPCVMKFFDSVHLVEALIPRGFDLLETEASVYKAVLWRRGLIRTSGK